MDRDDVSDAFARWKVAQDAFLAAEHRLFQTGGTNMHDEADSLFIEAQAKRAQAEKLLLVAMKLLHDRRQM